MSRIYFLIGVFLFLACQKKEPKNATEQVDLKHTPAFNSDSAYAFIEKQVSFGPRVPNTKNHEACSAYLFKLLENYSDTVIIQHFEEKTYTGLTLQGKNIIASFYPEKQKRILLAAHWDTRHMAEKDSIDTEKPIDGANDGASGVGVLLEIARVLSQSESKPQVGIDIILFDAEDYGNSGEKGEEYSKSSWCLGSQYWATHKHQKEYTAYYGILLDMVGAQNAQFYQERSSLEYAKKITEQVWTLGQQLGYDAFFISEPTKGGIIDDHSFINKEAKIPMTCIIQYDPKSPNTFFSDYHHTHKDNLSIIDKKTLKAVGQTVLQVLYQEE